MQLGSGCVSGTLSSSGSRGAAGATYRRPIGISLGGAGTIGLMVVATLKAYGAGEIIVTDFQAKRLQLAQELGADYVLNPPANTI